MARVPNRPTLEGMALGKELARLTDATEVETLQRFPKHMRRCQSCAFRAGTIPNGCPETVMDALKCVLEGMPFYCHQEMIDGAPANLCAGWAMMQHSQHRNPLRQAIKVPWKFSTEEGDADG